MLGTVIAELNAIFAREMPRVAVFTGSLYIRQHATPPRIVWVFDQDPFGPPKKLSNDYHSVYTREAGLQVHIWGVSYDQAEAMLHNVVTALHATLHGSLVVSTAQWLVAGQADWFTLGEACILPVRVRIPVLDIYMTIPVSPPPAEAQANPPPVGTEDPSYRAVPPATEHDEVTIVDATPGDHEAEAEIGDKEYT